MARPIPFPIRGRARAGGVASQPWGEPRRPVPPAETAGLVRNLPPDGENGGSNAALRTVLSPIEVKSVETHFV